MNITTRHPKSLHGLPVILDDRGKLLPYPRGIEAAIRRLRMKKTEIAARAGVNPYTVYGYCKGRIPPQAAFLNVLRDLLEDAEDVNSQCDTPQTAE